MIKKLLLPLLVLSTLISACTTPAMENSNNSTTSKSGFDLSDTTLLLWSQNTDKAQTIQFPFAFRAVNIILTHTSSKKTYTFKGDNQYIQERTIHFTPITEDPPFTLKGQFVSEGEFSDEFKVEHEFPVNHVIEFKAQISTPLNGEKPLVIGESQFAFKDLHACGDSEDTRNFCNLK